MYLDCYKIEGTVNNDQNPCFHNQDTHPEFQEKLEFFKKLLVQQVKHNKSVTYYKYGDGDYYFLTKQSVGSATPGKRALSKEYDSIGHEDFVEGAQLCDYYTCEIYPENIQRFSEVINREIDFPAEYGYGLVSNKWIFKTFAGQIGLIGADRKIDIIENIIEAPQYQEYLGIEKFEDYIRIPQQFACDDLEATEKMVGDQLEKSTSKIFLVGIGHVKSGLLHRLKKYTDAVFLDVGSSLDAIAGVIDVDRPYFGDWTNYQIDEKGLYNGVDFLQYDSRKGKHITLERE
tara:strand:- start:652 stop:1515 length:864 start_codon:yes stop_codon:yes gene_type:complete